MIIKVDKNTVVVFDLDDTLYNELDYLKSAYQEIAQQLDKENWHLLYANLLSLYRCKKDVFGIVSRQYKIPKEELIKRYRNHTPKIELFNGVLSTIRKIKELQGKIGIITDGRTNTQMEKLKALGLDKIVDHIIISEDIGTEKPHEQNYTLMEKAFENCSYIYIADNLKKDFITPNRLGWITIGLIDNGKNIHCNAHMHIDNEHRPKEFIIDYLGLRIEKI